MENSNTDNDSNLPGAGVQDQIEKQLEFSTFEEDGITFHVEKDEKFENTMFGRPLDNIQEVDFEEEIWSIGKYASTIVSNQAQRNTLFPSPPNPPESPVSDIEYYGGYLVCESVGNEQSAKLISAAPDLLYAAKEALRMYQQTNPVGGWQHVEDFLKSAIEKTK